MKSLPVFTVAMAALLLATHDARGQQQVKVEVDDIQVQTMPTPQFNYDGETKKLPQAREWIEVEVEFEAESANREDKFIDELEFTYYVVMKDAAATMLVQKVTHVNVPVKEKIFSNVFISPTTIVKLTGSEASSAGVVQGVAVEIRYQGALIGGDATESKASKWWQTKAQTLGLLLRKSETPFAILWTDRYAEEKKER